MLKMLNEFQDIFLENRMELITPEVVQVLTEEELIEIVPNADGWIIGDDPATYRVFEAGKRGMLKAAVKWGVGIDNVDFNACKKLNIPISNTPGMFGGEVADLAIGYLIGLARDSYRINQEVRRGQWLKPSGMSISGKCIAVIGLGDIGQSVIKRLKGFDVVIIGYDPYSNLDPVTLGIHGVYGFPSEIDKADFIILTCALTDSSRYMINEDSISKMKDGVYIINVARGQLIRELDLIAALKRGKVKGAALDVFEIEPLPLDNELRSFGQCIFGSHNGSNTVEAVRRASYQAIDLLFSYLRVTA